MKVEVDQPSLPVGMPAGMDEVQRWISDRR